MNAINMSTEERICLEGEIEQKYAQKCYQENNISIDILDDYSLHHVFKFLYIRDRMRLEMGEYLSLYIYLTDSSV